MAVACAISRCASCSSDISKENTATCLPCNLAALFATLAGCLLACLVLAIPLKLGLPDSARLDDAVLLTLIGGCIGLAQWFRLRKRYRHA